MTTKTDFPKISAVLIVRIDVRVNDIFGEQFLFTGQMDIPCCIQFLCTILAVNDFPFPYYDQCMIPFCNFLTATGSKSWW